MLQVARLAPNMLHDATERVVEFLLGQFNDDGGCKDRSGASDLYYTVFGLEGLVALRAEIPVDSTVSYLNQFEDGRDLDLVHVTCLARCWASMPVESLDERIRQGVLKRIEDFRTADGAYNETPEDGGSIYHSFLALGACQDLRSEPPGCQKLADCFESLETADGAYANETALPIGTTPVTAAAATVLRYLQRPIPPKLGQWLLAQCHPEGGFLAMPLAPYPDLLSTATALHALSGIQVSFEPVKERCLNFLDSLWTGRAFCGHWADDDVDVEYTYYALLALGHLSL